MARYVMAIDAAKCMNCKACIVACQQRNAVPYGHFRNWIRETPARESRTGLAYQPGACMHCDNPPCVAACPTLATFKADDGSVRIDKRRCIGCGGCIAACPYDARYKNPVTGTADKCDYCREASVVGQPPACVLACATRCRVFGDAEDPNAPVAGLLARTTQVRVVPAGRDPKPTLVYLNRTVPTDWPRQARIPGPLAAIAVASMGVRWLGGLVLCGVIGVFLKHLAFPKAGEADHHDTGGRA